MKKQKRDLPLPIRLLIGALYITLAIGAVVEGANEWSQIKTTAPVVDEVDETMFGCLEKRLFPNSTCIEAWNIVEFWRGMTFIFFGLLLMSWDFWYPFKQDEEARITMWFKRRFNR